MKYCPKCRETTNNFGTNRCTTDGLASYCRTCSRDIARTWRAANPDKCTARARSVYTSREWWHNLLLGSKSSAKVRGLSHNIDKDYIESIYTLQDGCCYWSGVALDTGKDNPRRYPARPSLDRLNSSIGYDPGNVVITTTFMNLGRSDTSAEDFKDFLLGTGLVETPVWEAHDVKLATAFAKAKK